MKQVVIKKGSALVVDLEPTTLQRGTIIVKTRASCISPGTEISSMISSGRNLYSKVKANPDKIKKALERINSVGFLSVFQKAMEKNNQEKSIGYSAAGIIEDVAEDVYGFKKGMRVAVAGAGYANHAEYSVIPVNLAVPIPDNVGFKEASTCALGGIALQGVRRSETTLGEFVAVIGCGAIGLLTVQLLKAAGCMVVGIDLDTRRLELAKKLGADVIFNSAQDNFIDSVVNLTNGYGVDKVIITASTNSNTVLSQSFRICRQKGRVVLVGVVGPEFKREDMYIKELDFVISTSYGPGRYDEQYERFGHDYPYGYVRWTEKRNMDAYMRCLSSGAVRVEDIIEATYPVDQVLMAYTRLKDDRLLLVTLNYDENCEETSEVEKTEILEIETNWSPPKSKLMRVGIVGAGNFTRSMHIPNMKRLREYYKVTYVCNKTGLSAREVAKLFTGCNAITDYEKLLKSDIDMVMIGTRHDTHAYLSMKALSAGKAVFVEKPMCITNHEYNALVKVVNESGAPFMVGYNRRFSPFSLKIKECIENRINPVFIQYTMNAGYVPYSQWIHTDEGGGRIVGEACHLIDLFRFIVGSPAVTVSVDVLTSKTGSVHSDDNAVITVRYRDGSVGTLLYTSIGPKKADKETMKVFCDGQLFEMQDYKIMKNYGDHKDLILKKQDKGHLSELKVFAECVVKGERFPIPWEELKETWEITRQIADTVRTEM